MILLFACAGIVEPSDSSPAYDPDLGVAAELGFGPGEAESALATIFSEARGYNALPVFASYNEITPLFDETCPAATSVGEGATIWDTDGCTTAGGTTVAGFVSHFVDPNGSRSTSMNAEARVVTPVGITLVIAGVVQYVDELGGGQTSEVAAVVEYNGAAAQNTWIEQNLDLNVFLDERTTESGEVAGVALSGDVGFSGGSIDGVDFHDFSVATDRDCPEEPAGSIGLRGSAGVWAELSFDVSGNDEEGYTQSGECDGCGTLSSQGEALGSVCVSVDAFFSGGA